MGMGLIATLSKIKILSTDITKPTFGISFKIKYIIIKKPPNFHE
ncbi:hypothetical protein GCM10028868_15650 [Virgibacillus kimchii]